MLSYEETSSIAESQNELHNLKSESYFHANQVIAPFSHYSHGQQTF